MPDFSADDPGRFQPLIEAAEQHADLFSELYVPVDAERESVSGLRRRRRRAANNLEDPIKAVSLVEEDGVLYWRDGVPGSDLPSTRRRRAARAGDTGPSGTVVFTNQFPALAPNKIGAAIGMIDQRLNSAIGVSLRSRLRLLRRLDDQFTNGKFVFDDTDIKGPFAGRTLLFVHGTFSNASNMINEFAATGPGRELLNRAFEGEKKYDRVVFFEHATLAVSPVINALELGRAFAGSSGEIDVVAHSRGGLIVRWWLEAFGSSLRLDEGRPVRVIFAGSPLHGTSLAAPDKLQGAMSLISNIGTFAAATLKFVGATTNPFLWVGGKLVEVVVSATGALAKTPLIDVLVTLIPGLSSQSAVSNNHELDRLRLGPCAVSPNYFAVVSNFEPADPGWKFWRSFRARAGNAAADIVFPGANDLVVDTWSMTDLGDHDFALKIADDVCDFGTSETVWHCNYFVQDKTIKYISAKFS